MSDRPGWFDGSIIGAVAAVILLPATASTGFANFFLNVAACVCFVAPIVVALRDGDLKSAA